MLKLMDLMQDLRLIVTLMLNRVYSTLFQILKTVIGYAVWGIITILMFI
jgi:hypothetical protein